MNRHTLMGVLEQITLRWDGREEAPDAGFEIERAPNFDGFLVRMPPTVPMTPEQVEAWRKRSNP